MIVCAIPPLRNAIIEDDSILRIVIVEPLGSLGNVYSVFILIFLRANIYLLDPSTAVISNRTILITTLVKLILSPLIGIYVI
jgi:predicted permease